MIGTPMLIEITGWLGAAILVAAFGLLWLVFAPVRANYMVTTFPPMLLIGVGLGIAFPPLMLYAMSDTTEEDAGVASGVLATSSEVGGAIVFRSNGRKAQMIRVLGPRNSPVGPIGRLRATLRPLVVRVVPGGAPAIGGRTTGGRIGLEIGRCRPLSASADSTTR